MTKGVFGKFKEHSIAEFFKKNKQMLGFSGKVRSLTTIIHEYVTNSLDACQEAGILPEIFVEIREIDKNNDRYMVIVEDNGTGIPKTHIGKALGRMLAGTKFHRFVQQRGQQGIGAAGCTMFAMLTTGKGVKAKSGHKGKVFECGVSIDFKTNSPVVDDLEELDEEFKGLRVVGEFGEVKYEKGSRGTFEYIRRTALVNPYLKITFKDPFGEVFVFNRSSEEVPEKPKEIQPHPLGVGPHELLEMGKTEKKFNKISSFLQNRFARVSAAKVKELDSLLPEINFNKKPKDLSWAEAEEMARTFPKVKWIAPSPEGIIPIGKELIEKSFVNVLNPEMIAVVERKPQLYKGGVPFVVEVGIGWGGDLTKEDRRGEVMRFANKSPLLFDAGACAITNSIKEIDWKRYELRNFGDEPVAIMVNISSVHVPYVSAGKQAIAKEEEVMLELRNAIMEAGRNIKKYLSGKRRDKDRETKKKLIRRYIKQFSKDLVDLAEGGDPEIVEKNLEELVEHKYD